MQLSWDMITTGSPGKAMRILVRLFMGFEIPIKRSSKRMSTHSGSIFIKASSTDRLPPTISKLSEL